MRLTRAATSSCAGTSGLLRQRVITAVAVLAVFCLATYWLAPTGFALFLSLLLLPALVEWCALMGVTRRRAIVAYLLLAYGALAVLVVLLQGGGAGFDPFRLAVLNGAAVGFWLLVLALVARYPAQRQSWHVTWKIGLMGLPALLPSWLALLYLKQLHTSGVLVFVLIALVSAADIGAYFVGRAWGRRRLAPALSPNKSWAGFWGGISAAAVLAGLLIGLMHWSYQPMAAWLWLVLVAAAVLVAMFGVLGDLFESMLKRERGLKDSSHLLPGHGGALDRIDSLVAAAPVFVLALLLLSGQVAWL